MRKSNSNAIADNIFVVLGANLKHPKKQINEAITRIGQFATVQKTSEFYFSKPYGMEGGNDFVNRAIIISTELLPDQFLERILTIEANMGRIRADKWISRIIDIDILFWGQLCHRDDGLTIPHHDYLNRDFFLLPAAEIAPDFIPPMQSQSLRELQSQCPTQVVYKKEPDSEFV
jgi:2-amino-4-hydroxy-6-hydroxymethyldihydropteridine diphosphokinase